MNDVIFAAVVAFGLTVFFSHGDRRAGFLHDLRGSVQDRRSRIVLAVAAVAAVAFVAVVVAEPVNVLLIPFGALAVGLGLAVTGFLNRRRSPGSVSRR